jgi:hypothetical protein
MRLEQRGRVKPPYFEFNWQQEETREYGKTVHHSEEGWWARSLDGSGVNREVHAPLCVQRRLVCSAGDTNLPG